jgi:hypothetical protein
MQRIKKALKMAIQNLSCISCVIHKKMYQLQEENSYHEHTIVS